MLAPQISFTQVPSRSACSARQGRERVTRYRSGTKKTGHGLPTQAAGTAHLNHHFQTGLALAQRTEREQLRARQNLAFKQPKHNWLLAKKALSKKRHDLLHLTNSGTTPHALMPEVRRSHTVLLE